MLDNFPKEPLGQVYLANAYLAYSDPCIDKGMIKEYLNESEEICSTSSSSDLESIIQSFPCSNHSKWKSRTSNPVPRLSDNLTAVLSIETLDSVEPICPAWLFDKDFIDNAKEQVPDGGKIEYLIQAMENTNLIKADVKLGEGEKPQFIAPELEVNALKVVDKHKQADNIRDALGLAHLGKNIHLIQITLNKFLIKELINNDQVKLATPLFVDAKSHRYFRTYSKCPDNWGRTKHLTDKNHSGIKEAITSPIPIAETVVRIDYLGRLKEDPDITEPSIQKHAQSLLPKGKTITDITHELSTFLKS